MFISSKTIEETLYKINVMKSPVNVWISDIGEDLEIYREFVNERDHMNVYNRIIEFLENQYGADNEVFDILLYDLHELINRMS